MEEQWHVRDWNLWSPEKADRFLAGDYTLKLGEEASRCEVSMETYMKHAVKTYTEDGGILTSRPPDTPMTTGEEGEGARVEDENYEGDVMVDHDNLPVPGGAVRVRLIPRSDRFNLNSLADPTPERALQARARS